MKLSLFALALPFAAASALPLDANEAKCPCTKLCPEGQVCIALPKGCQEICVVPRFCGGIAAIDCDDGFTCIDNPNDSCDPRHGGADCGGICIPRRS